MVVVVVVEVADADGGGGTTNGSGGGSNRQRQRDGIGTGGGGEAAKTGVGGNTDVVLRSRCCTRGCCGVLLERLIQKTEYVYLRIHLEMWPQTLF